MAERFYIEHAPIGTTIELEKDEAHHLLHVRRVRAGDEVVLFDGSGTDFFGRVANVAKSKVVIEIIRTEQAKREPHIQTTLAVAVLKQAGMDSLIDMATQLGVKRIIPVMTEHCVARPHEAKTDRWRRIAIEACKQCGRSVIPQIEPVQSYADMLDEVSRHEFASIMSLRPGTKPLIDALPAKLSKALILIGPEGDFTDAEISAAIAAGCAPVTLGRCVLRAETAAAAALAVIMQRDVQN